MTFEQAASRQHLYSSFYVVFLVAPDGIRERLGHTARKSGTGLLRFLYLPKVQERIKQLPDIENARLHKFSDRLEFSNGYKTVFGGTIRQEAE